MIPALACVPLLSVPGPAAQEPVEQEPIEQEVESRASTVEQLLAELRLLDQAGMSSVIVTRYTHHVVDLGVLARQGEALALVAAATFATGDEQAAKNLLHRAVTTPQSFPFVELQRVRFSIEEDELERAIQDLTEVRNRERTLRYPEQPESWLLLARIHARLEQYDQASPAAVRFLTLAPRHREASTAWHILSQAAVKAHDADHARTCRERAEELATWYGLLQARSIQVLRHRDDPLPRLGLALLWMEAEQYDQAQGELVFLTTHFPDFCRGWFHRGEVERLAFDDDEALRAYERALACDPAHAPARMNRAMLRLERGESEAARADLELLVAGEAGADPVYASAHLFLARLCLAAEDAAGAEASYARYRELGGTEPLEE